MVVRADLEHPVRVDVVQGGDERGVVDRDPDVGPAGDEVVVARPERAQELAGDAVEHDAPADLAGLDERLALDAADDQIDQHALVRRVEVPVVRRHHLEVPLQLAGVDVDGQDRVRVERVARTPQGGRPGRRLAGAEVDPAQLGVVADRVPRQAAERLDFVLAPRLVARLASRRHRVGDPQPLAGLGVVRHDGAPRAAVAPGEAQHHLAVGDQRGVRMPQSGGVVAGAHLPALLARAGIQDHQRGVRGAPVDRVAVDRHAAVTVEGLRLLDVLGVAARVLPHDVASRDVEAGDAAAPFGDVHQPVGDDRRRHPAAPVAHRVGPDETQVADRLAIDLLERTEPGHVVRPPEVHPVAVPRIEQPLVGDRLPVPLLRLPERGAGLQQLETGEERQNEQAVSECSHRSVSFPSPAAGRSAGATPDPGIIADARGGRNSANGYGRR